MVGPVLLGMVTVHYGLVKLKKFFIQTRNVKHLQTSCLIIISYNKEAWQCNFTVSVECRFLLREILVLCAADIFSEVTLVIASEFGDENDL